MSEPIARAENFLQSILKKYERIVYNRNPLVQVIAQIRFPTILSIDTAGPARFQELIADAFPILETEQVFSFSVSAPDGGHQNGKPSLSHNFYTEDRKWQLGLTSNSASLSTGVYENWDDFYSKLCFVMENAFAVYKIPIVSRIGLRYQDVIDREALSLGTPNWTDLISPDILGILRSSDIDDTILTHSHSSNMLQLGRIKALLQYGLFNKPNTAEKFYLIDSDLHIDRERRIDLDDLKNEFIELHKLSGPLFRWSITETLHDALKSS